MQTESGKQPSAEVGFREALTDVVAIVTKLGPLCQDLPHLIEICQIGLQSDPQLHFLMRLVQAKR